VVQNFPELLEKSQTSKHGRTDRPDASATETK
jgi:hypothetical protein